MLKCLGGRAMFGLFQRLWLPFRRDWLAQGSRNNCAVKSSCRSYCRTQRTGGSAQKRAKKHYHDITHYARISAGFRPIFSRLSITPRSRKNAPLAG